MSESEFLYYPELDDESFYEDIYRKKEFRKSEIDPEEYYSRTLEDICGSGGQSVSSEKILQPHQEFLRNYMSTETPYNGILLFHGVGTGKCILPGSSVTTQVGQIPIETLWENFSSKTETIFDGEGFWTEPMDPILVQSWNSVKGEWVERPINRFYRQKVDEPVRYLQLENGGKINLTQAHHLLSKENGWTNQIYPGMSIAIPDGETIQFVQIHSLTEKPYQGWVYDLEITELHNFVANNVICHNTCAAISIAESMKPKLKALGKKVYIIAPGQTQPNFENEIYSLALEDKERADGAEPGSYQCTGQAYYIPPRRGLDEERRRNKIKREAFGARSVYQFFGQGTSFPSFVEFTLKKPQETFSNSIIIVDEVHGIVSEVEKDLEDTPKKTKKVTIGSPERGPTPLKNTLDTLKDIFSGYHAFKTKWIQGNTELKMEMAQYRSQLEDGKRSKANISKMIAKEIETKATIAWKNLSATDRKEWLKQAPKNTKLILMTASPMQNSPTEIVELINLLRLNDRRSLLDTSKLFQNLNKPGVDVQDQVDTSYLCKMGKGYISYVRGQSPITFPGVLDPPEEILYNPGYINPNDPMDIPVPLYNIDGQGMIVGIKYKLGLVYCPMSIKQYAAHTDWVTREISTPSRGGVQLGLGGRQLSNIIFPTSPPTWGNSAFYNVFKTVKREPKLMGKTVKGAPITKRPGIQFNYNDTFGIEGIRAFIKQEDLVDSPEFGQLHIYSPKFNKIIENMQDPDKWGINFCYSDFVPSGALILGIVLELNGFVRYTQNAGFRPTRAGKYPIGSYDSLLSTDFWDKWRPMGLERKYRCYRCARLDVDPIHNMDGDDPLKHEFKQGTFSLFIGEGSDTQRAMENEVVKQRDNKYGEIIKVVIGSKVSAEGVNFMNVRQVHIIDPWHHNTRLYQVMGRAIRHCSHKDLPKSERNVTVYKYSATVPELLPDQRQTLKNMKRDNINLAQPASPETNITFRDLMTETTDEMFYFRALRKDVLIKYVERILKQIAVDCSLFKPQNVFPQDIFPSEVDGTRICDYLPCNYQCIWECGPPVEYYDPEKEYPLNVDTYNLSFSKSRIDRVIRHIQKLFTKNWALTLEDLISLVQKQSPKTEVEYIYQALDRMLQDIPGRPIILDKYKREGYLIFRGNYYIVQPLEFSREDIPIYYRSKALKIKPRARNIDRLKPSEVMIAKKEVLNTQKLDTLIEKLAESNDTIQIETALDRLSAKELQYVWETVVLTMGNTPIYEIISDYLDKRHLLLEDATSKFGHIILEARMFKPAKDENLAEFVSAPEVRVDAANRFLAEQQLVKLNQEGPIILFDPESDFDSEYRFYGYVDNGDFKLADLRSEVTKKTRENIYSKKTFVRGKTCVNFQKGDLQSIAQVLSEIPDADLLTPEERTVLANKTGNKSDFCQRIEKTLRILNLRDENRRWFLYPGEYKCIEHIQGKHVLRKDPETKEIRTCTEIK